MDSEKITSQPKGDIQSNSKGFNMEKIDTLTAKDIQKMPEEKFLTLLRKSFKEVKDITINKVEMHDLAKGMAMPRFDKIQKFIRYKEHGTHFEITTPLIDEKQRKANKKDNSRFKIELQEYRSLPDTDNYIRCDSVPIQRSLGVLVIEHRGYYIPRKFGEHKYEDNRLHYIKESFFYFDFQKKKYQQAFDEEVIELKRLHKNNKEIDESKYNQHSLIFFKRDKLLSEIEDRLKEISEERDFRQKFNLFTATKSPTSKNIKSLRKYALNYYSFLEHLNDWLQIKLYLAQITPLEYKFLSEENDALMTICKNLFTSPEYNDDDVKRLEKFRKGKPEDDKLRVYNAMDGFIKYDLKNRILIPTIVEVERRRSFRLNDSYSDIRYEEYLERTMRFLDKIKAQQDKQNNQ